MRRRAVAQFVTGASLAVVACGCALAAWAPAAWPLMAFLAVALPAIAAGAWLAAEHGRPGPRFLTAFGAGIAARVLGAATVLALARASGAPALRGAVAGVLAAAAGLLLFEMLWFARAAAAGSARAEAGR